MTTEPWASVEDVAKHLGVAKDSVYRWIEPGTIGLNRLLMVVRRKLPALKSLLEAPAATGNARKTKKGKAHA